MLWAPAISCGSEPARDSGGSACIDVGCAGVFASKLAPTVLLRLFTELMSTAGPCGSELARDSGGSACGEAGCARDNGGSACGEAGWAGAFASRLAPTGFGVGSGCCGHPQSLVGASLLAIAVGLLVVRLDVPASSRAGSLPQGGGVKSGCCGRPQSLVGASLLAIAVGLLVVRLDVPAPSRASSLPQGLVLSPDAGPDLDDQPAGCSLIVLAAWNRIFATKSISCSVMISGGRKRTVAPWRPPSSTIKPCFRQAC